jgi:hypothetical protein
MRPSGEFYLLDEPFGDLRAIPDLWGTTPISMISDRLCCLCALRSIEIPEAIRSIGSCFHLIKNCPEILEIGRSIELIDGFIEVYQLTFVRFGVGSELRYVRGFLSCPSLHGIIFPATVEIVHGFFNCGSLVEVHFERESRVREIRGFCQCAALPEFELPDSTEMLSGFDDCSSLGRVIFGDRSSLRVLQGFVGCDSLEEISIPASVEQVLGFDACVSLNCIRFAPDSHLRIMRGFLHLRSLIQVEIPPSVERITGFDFSGLRRLTLLPGTRLRRIFSAFDPLHAFVGYEEADLRSRRRRVSMNALCLRAARHGDPAPMFASPW